MSSEEQSPGLLLSGVSHRFGGLEVLRNVDVAVAPGEIVCLLGPSGCGKTTTLRIAAGLEPLQHGTVSIAGHEVGVPGREIPPEKRRVGLMFQDYALFPHLSVADNVAFGLRSLNARERQRRAHELLERVGLAGRADDFPHVLSGGEQQRVALARALAPSPVVMLFDEPFSGLDVRLRTRVRDETLRVLKELNVATLLVTHDSEEAMFMADRIALMRDGQVVQLGTPQQLYDAPVDTFAASFFGEVNEFSGTVQDGLVTTPVGPVHSTLTDATSVDVLIRPEDLIVDAAESQAGGTLAEVEAVHLLGPSTWLNLSETSCGIGLSARVAKIGKLSVGSQVRIRLDRGRAFVFPANQKI
jgi:iron(III) transport system ATP-binding protein